MKRALISGITGQDGSYLAELLLKGYEVHGIIRRSSSFNTGRIEHIYQDPHERELKFYLHYGDLADGSRLEKLMEIVEPDEVYNLGAQSHVRVSFDEPVYTADIGAHRDAAFPRSHPQRRRHPDRALLSGLEFGDLRQGARSPAARDHAVPSAQPYACAKAFSFYHGELSRSLRAARLQRHSVQPRSPRRGETFVTRKITRGLARILAGKDKKLYLGNLDAHRDWGYAKDYVEAMWLMLQQDEPDDYVIATGESWSVQGFPRARVPQVGLDWQRIRRIRSALLAAERG